MPPPPSAAAPGQATLLTTEPNNGGGKPQTTVAAAEEAAGKAEARRQEQKRKSDWIDSIVDDPSLGIVSAWSERYQRQPATERGVLRKVAGHLTKIAKRDGFKADAECRQEIRRIVEQYLRDEEPFVRDKRHPLRELLGDRLERYRSPKEAR